MSPVRSFQKKPIDMEISCLSPVNTNPWIPAFLKNSGFWHPFLQFIFNSWCTQFWSIQLLHSNDKSLQPQRIVILEMAFSCMHYVHVWWLSIWLTFASCHYQIRASPRHWICIYHKEKHASVQSKQARKLYERYITRELFKWFVLKDNNGHLLVNRKKTHAYYQLLSKHLTNISSLLIKHEQYTTNK